MRLDSCDSSRLHLVKVLVLLCSSVMECEYSDIILFPRQGVWRTAQLHDRGLDIDDCCSLRTGCADEGNELVHILRHVFPSKEIEDAEAYVRVAMIQFLSDPSFKQFHAHHKTYMRSANVEFRSLITYKKRVADGDELSDPLTVHPVAAMQNIHVGIIFECTYWCTREDGKLWDCDIVMACLQDPEGTRRRRFICIKKLKCKGHAATLHVAFPQSVRPCAYNRACGSVGHNPRCRSS